MTFRAHIVIASLLLLLGGTIAHGTAQSSQPENSPAAKAAPTQAQSRISDRERPRSQVIYNLSSASRETAVTLHQQSKNTDVSLPIDPNMPISLQLSRANANSDAAAAQQRNAVAPPVSSPRQERGNMRARKAQPTRIVVKPKRIAPVSPPSAKPLRANSR